MQIVIDTSALFAVLMREDGYEPLREILLIEPILAPAVVVVELSRVALRRGIADETIGRYFQQLGRGQFGIEPFNAEMALIAQEANRRFGSGNGTGGLLNLLDLMVYATAKALDRPILCTGRDFASTDAKIHPASRIG